MLRPLVLLPPRAGRSAVKLAPLRRRSRGERLGWGGDRRGASSRALCRPFTPTLALPHQGGGNRRGKIFARNSLRLRVYYAMLHGALSARRFHSIEQTEMHGFLSNLWPACRYSTEECKGVGRARLPMRGKRQVARSAPGSGHPPAAPCLPLHTDGKPLPCHSWPDAPGLWSHRRQSPRSPPDGCQSAD